MSIQRHVIEDTTPAAESTVAGDTVGGLSHYDSLHVVAELAGATGGSLDVYLQTSHDGGSTWYDIAHYPQLAAGAAAIVYAFTASIGEGNAIVAVGKNATPALAANTLVRGAWGDKIRALYKAGASTSAGAAVTITILGQSSRK